MVVQTAPSEFCVYHTERQAQFAISATFRVKGLGVGNGTILLWNSKQITLYDVDVTFQADIYRSYRHEVNMLIY